MKHIPDAVSMLIQIQQWAVFVSEVMSCVIRPALKMCTFPVFIFENN